PWASSQWNPSTAASRLNRLITGPCPPPSAGLHLAETCEMIGRSAPRACYGPPTEHRTEGTGLAGHHGNETRPAAPNALSRPHRLQPYAARPFRHPAHRPGDPPRAVFAQAPPHRSFRPLRGAGLVVFRLHLRGAPAVAPARGGVRPDLPLRRSHRDD